MSNSNGIYVEIPIRASLDRIWEHTQTPDLHEKWDLRFSRIDYLPRPATDAPQHFRYTTRIGFGLRISGEGESLGTRRAQGGGRTSALKFWSQDRLSLIQSGSGYWKYVPDGDQVRFLTWYDYQVRFGRPGQVLDRLVFRPVLGWATAWSFDCLRVWLESGIPPAISIRRSLIQLASRLCLGAVWIYQGLVPKILYPYTGELEILRRTGLFPGFEVAVLTLIGLAEIAFGLVFLISGAAVVHILNIFALLALTAGALVSQPEIFAAPFNPLSLNLAMIVLSAVTLINQRDLVSAGNCQRTPEPR